MVQVVVKRNNELYHSDTFFGDSYSDELCHYKYIKKEKRNGKWIYIYESQKLKEDAKEFLTGKNARNKMFESSLKKAASESNRDNASKMIKNNPNSKLIVEENTKIYNRALKDVQKYEKEYKKSLKAYEKTFPGRISKGKKKVQKLFKTKK